MAFLFVDSLTQNNSRVVQISVKALELLLLSAGLISTLVILKGAVVPSCEIAFSSLLGIWSSIRCFFSSPLTICIIIHVIMALIAASSTFNRHKTNHQDDESTVINVGDHEMQIVESFVAPLPPPASPPPSPPRDVFEVNPPLPAARDIAEVATETPSSRISTPSTLYQGGINHDVSPYNTQQNHGENATPVSSSASLFFSEAHEIKKTAYSLNSSPDNSLEPTKENGVTTDLPLLPGKLIKEEIMEKEDKATSNFSDNKENEEEDTMEATWKAITGGGKQRPTKKHLKKSETWDVPPRRSVAVQRLDSEELLPTTPKWKELKKAETFNDAVSVTRRGGLIRRDPSMSIEEFNQQVEAFIKKFNDNMRLERQESHKRFLNMINNTGL